MNDQAIPAIGLGTWGLTEERGAQAIEGAIEIGYRHIDTAQSYATERPVGEALARTSVARDEIFVTTKITEANFPRLAESLQESTQNLGGAQIDLTLIHWPSRHDAVPVESYVSELARAQDAGLTRLIGVSNFTRRHIDQAIAAIGPGRIATNQVECHPYLQNRVLAAHCSDANIPLTAYMPLASGRLGSDTILQSIAARHGATAEQIALAYLLKRGHIVIPKSSHAGRQRANLEAGSIELSASELSGIERLDRGDRIVDPDWGPDWD